MQFAIDITSTALRTSLLLFGLANFITVQFLHVKTYSLWHAEESICKFHDPSVFLLFVLPYHERHIILRFAKALQKNATCMCVLKRTVGTNECVGDDCVVVSRYKVGNSAIRMDCRYPWWFPVFALRAICANNLFVNLRAESTTILRQVKIESGLFAMITWLNFLS